MSQPNVADLSFEEAMAELEQVVAKLEKGEVALEESIALYERGAALKTHCEQHLARAEEKIAQITGDGSGTTPASYS